MRTVKNYFRRIHPCKVDPHAIPQLMYSELLRTALDLSDKQLDEYLEFSERALLVPDDAERRDKSKQHLE